MFSSYPRDTATSQDLAMLPPLQQNPCPINNAYIPGALIEPTGIKEATQESDFRPLVGLEQDYLINPYYQTTSPHTELYSELHEQFQQPATAGSNSAYMGNPNYQAIPRNAASVPESYQPRVFESPTDHISLMDSVSSNTDDPVSSEAILQQLLYFDEPWAKLGGDKIDIGLALPEELKRSSNDRHRKRLRTPEPDLGAGPSQWMAEPEDHDGAEPLNTRGIKRRKISTERETEDRVAAQRGDTQELCARRTSAGMNDKSKLGNQGLGEETLVAPSQGVYPPFSPRPTTGATLGPTEFEGQAWTWTEGSESISEGTGDVYDEETDGERWTRLRVKEGDVWKCRECTGATFFDRSTLRRHCKTVHGRECDRWKCPQCPDKSYSRKSGLDRHMRGKHQGEV